MSEVEWSYSDARAEKSSAALPGRMVQRGLCFDRDQGETSLARTSSQKEDTAADTRLVKASNERISSTMLKTRRDVLFSIYPST